MLTLQNPIGSGFGAASTASDVISGLDLSGRVAIVTGDYSGLSLETTRALLSAGAKVTVPARDHNRAASALDGLDGVRGRSTAAGPAWTAELTSAFRRGQTRDLIALAAVQPNVRLETVTGTHGLLFEQSQAIAHLVLAFLAS